jgi:hypothetical protein
MFLQCASLSESMSCFNLLFCQTKTQYKSDHNKRIINCSWKISYHWAIKDNVHCALAASWKQLHTLHQAQKVTSFYCTNICAFKAHSRDFTRMLGDGDQNIYSTGKEGKWWPYIIFIVQQTQISISNSSGSEILIPNPIYWNRAQPFTVSPTTASRGSRLVKERMTKTW